MLAVNGSQPVRAVAHIGHPPSLAGISSMPSRTSNARRQWQTNRSGRRAYQPPAVISGQLSHVIA
ncbi:hypothetical protein HanIR_Chr03g0121321 [Helianthus annuus]|nr:hypothetical protein HanIR_Chr03g0121321 [Helianthus annuus]